MATDPYFDADAQLERELSPTRNGVLSAPALYRIELRLRKETADLHDTRRLFADAMALRWKLRWAIADLCGLRQSWSQQATEVRRLQDRLTHVLSYLTDEQYRRLVADDTARREAAS